MTNRIVSAFVIFFIFPFTNSSQARTLIYAGTFDPFHLTHREELLGGMKAVGADQAIVLPVEYAYYSAIGDAAFPKAFPFESRLEMIKKAIEGLNGIEVRDDLKEIRGDVLRTITQTLAQLGAEDTSILVGTDVLEVWKDLPYFEEFLQNHEIVISGDTKNPADYERLKSSYAHNHRLKFIMLDLPGIRARDVKYAIFSNLELAKETLPAPLYAYLKDNPQLLDQLAMRIEIKSSQYFEKLSQQNIAKALHEFGAPPQAVSLLTRGVTAVELFKLAINDSPDISKLVSNLSLAPSDQMQTHKAVAALLADSQTRQKMRTYDALLAIRDAALFRLEVRHETSTPGTLSCLRLGARFLN